MLTKGSLLHKVFLFFWMVLVPFYVANASTHSDSKTISVRLYVPPVIKTTVKPILETNSFTMCVSGRGVGRYRFHIPGDSSGVRLITPSSSVAGRVEPGQYSQAESVLSSSLVDCKSGGIIVTPKYTRQKDNQPQPVRLIVTAE